jgi:dTDP-4-dehydrorhamnose reductase
VARLDATSPGAVARHLARGFDFVVFAAGLKDVERCERDPERAFALNARPMERMADLVRRQGLPTALLYLSTDYVFDGERGRYGSEEEPAPRTAYGRSKRRGELALLEAGGRHKVVRSGAVLGRGAGFFDWLTGELGAGREVALFDDCFVSPTPAALLADLVLELLLGFEDEPGRVLHFVGDRRMSRFDVGRVAADLMNVDGAAIRGVPRASGGALFQHDLSLLPSARVTAVPRPSLEAAMRAELEGP